jgi:hypothetical protein
MFRKVVENLFYHRGKVTTDYKQFLLLSSSVSCITSVEYSISTHCLLTTISNTGSIMTANFLTKDMLGQVGGLVILSHLKKWSPDRIRLASCILIHFGLVCDVIVMWLPLYVIPLTVTSTIVKNVAYTLISSINISTLHSVTPKENIGEAYIGYSALSTVASSVGMAVGLGLVHYQVWHPVVIVSGIVRYGLLLKLSRLK